MGRLAQSRCGEEDHTTSHGDGDGREDVAVRIIQDIVRDGRNPGTAQLALRPHLRWDLRILVELEVVVERGKGAHPGIKFPATLYATYDIKRDQTSLYVYLLEWDEVSYITCSTGGGVTYLVFVSTLTLLVRMLEHFNFENLCLVVDYSYMTNLKIGHT